MGVTIHYRLGQEKQYVPKMLDRAQKLAETIKQEQASKTGTEFEITREHPYRLTVAIGGCEWLQFGFGGWKHWKEKGEKGYSYEHSTLPDAFKDDLEDERMMWCSAFCKTQYANDLVEHLWVAEILRNVASYCRYVEVYDEGDYYHSGDLQDATHAIGENGKMIASLGAQLRDAFGADNVIAGGETTIKPTRCKQPWCRKTAGDDGFCTEHRV